MGESALTVCVLNRDFQNREPTNLFAKEGLWLCGKIGSVVTMEGTGLVTLSIQATRSDPEISVHHVREWPLYFGSDLYKLMEVYKITDPTQLVGRTIDAHFRVYDYDHRKRRCTSECTSIAPEYTKQELRCNRSLFGSTHPILNP